MPYDPKCPHCGERGQIRAYCLAAAWLDVIAWEDDGTPADVGDCDNMEGFQVATQDELTQTLETGERVVSKGLDCAACGETFSAAELFEANHLTPQQAANLDRDAAD